MLIPPSGQALLDIAQREEQKLKDADFAGNRRYTTLLITRAQEIAQRDAAKGGTLARQELELLLDFYAEAYDLSREHDIQDWLYTLNSRLASDLRTRSLNSEQLASVLDVLDTQVQARLAITNPKLLNTADSHE